MTGTRSCSGDRRGCAPSANTTGPRQCADSSSSTGARWFRARCEERAMQRREPQPGAVAIALHDVSPATWRECRALLAMLDATGAGPLSLLVVPHYHYRAPITADE